MQSTVSFALSRPAGFVNFCGAGRGGAKLAFCGAGRGSPFFRGAGRASLSQTVDDRLDRLDKIKVFPGFSYMKKSFQMIIKYGCLACELHKLEPSGFNSKIKMVILKFGIQVGIKFQSTSF